jgi:hypothetical protein
MSSELERRLEGLLAEAGEPEPGSEEKALHRALRALHPTAPARRGLRTAVLVLAAAIVLLVIAAGSLAAAGALHVSFGAKAKARPVSAQLSLPKGANGVAAIVNGRLSVVTKSGFRIAGLPASAAALSPHALYVAAGIGHSLVAMRPNGSQAWSRPVDGRVVAIAWAPDAIRIAYVVDMGRRFALHVIWGTGTNDTIIDRSVRPVRPSWRADSLAFAYVGGGGRAIVYDLAHEKRSVVGTTAPVTRLAFAPVGRTLAVATPGAVVLDGETVASGRVEALGWFHGRPAVALATRTVPFIRSFGRTGNTVDNFRVPGNVVALTGGLVVTQTPDKVVAGWRDKSVSTLLGVGRATSVEDVVVG